jgi:hypothetical protein
MTESSTNATDIINALHSTTFSVADRVAILRALRDTTPGLVAADPRLEGRIRAAQAVKPEHVDRTITAMENSQVWQQVASTTPAELRANSPTSTSRSSRS